MTARSSWEGLVSFLCLLRGEGGQGGGLQKRCRRAARLRCTDSLLRHRPRCGCVLSFKILVSVCFDYVYLFPLDSFVVMKKTHRYPTAGGSHPG
jgi:hypothetical protein